jgi:hypothetical protein
MALGAMTSSGQPPAASVAVSPDESQGATVEALRPAWASWMPIFWL